MRISWISHSQLTSWLAGMQMRRVMRHSGRGWKAWYIPWYSPRVCGMLIHVLSDPVPALRRGMCSVRDIGPGLNTSLRPGQPGREDESVSTHHLHGALNLLSMSIIPLHSRFRFVSCRRWVGHCKHLPTHWLCKGDWMNNRRT